MKLSFRGWAVGIGLLLAAGCGPRRENVTLAGSTAFQPFAEKLAERFMAANPVTSVTVQGGGSTVGIQAALLGTAQIGMADLVALPTEARKLTATVVARDGIAVIVNPACTVTNLTLDQVRDLFNGTIRNWSGVGGADAPVTVISREAGSGTRSSFEQIVGNVKLAAEALIQDANGPVRETVAKDARAIGYLSHGLVNPSVRGVSVDGEPCTTDAILAGRYRLVRPVFFLTRGPPEGLAKRFVDFVLSDEGQREIAADGLIPAR
jgi:phosphate transport system substrate-binding protein